MPQRPVAEPSEGEDQGPVTVAPNDFTHLHVHSEFSLLDGLGRINDLTTEAQRLGFDSLAITDHGALYGAVAFYQACTGKGIKPIIGVETYVARRSMRDKEGKAGVADEPGEGGKLEEGREKRRGKPEDDDTAYKLDGTGALHNSKKPVEDESNREYVEDG